MITWKLLCDEEDLSGVENEKIFAAEHDSFPIYRIFSKGLREGTRLSITRWRQQVSLKDGDIICKIGYTAGIT